MGDHDVYIAHVDADVAAADALTTLLAALNVRAVSLHRDDAQPRLAEVARAITAARAVAFVLSAETRERYDVMHEVLFAVELERPLFVLRVGSPKIPIPEALRVLVTERVLDAHRPCGRRLVKALKDAGLPLKTESKAAGARAVREFDEVVSGTRHRRRRALVAAAVLACAGVLVWSLTRAPTEAARTPEPPAAIPPAPAGATAAPDESVPRPTAEIPSLTGAGVQRPAAALLADSARPQSLPWSPLPQDPRLKALRDHFHAIVARDFEAFVASFSSPMERLFVVDPCTDATCGRARLAKDFRPFFADDRAAHARITPIRYQFTEGHDEVRVWKRTNIFAGGEYTHFCTCDVYRFIKDDNTWRISAWYNEPNKRDETCEKWEAWCFTRPGS